MPTRDLALAAIFYTGVKYSAWLFAAKETEAAAKLGFIATIVFFLIYSKRTVQ